MVKLSISALVIAIALGGSAAAAPTCFNKKEHRASQVRQLQTELMVAALSCKSPHHDFASRYNSFVRKFGANLVDNAETLRGYFSRAYGKRHAKQFDSYITALANDASRRSMNSATFCDESVALFQEVGSIDRNGLESWSERRAATHTVPFESCGAEDKNAKSVVR